MLTATSYTYFQWNPKLLYVREFTRPYSPPPCSG